MECDRTKKVLVIRGYGLDWDYSLYLVSREVVERAHYLLQSGQLANAYKEIFDNSKTNDLNLLRDDWYDLRTVDMIIEEKHE